MTSNGATSILRDDYMLTFRVQGQVYRRVGSFLELPDVDPKSIHIYDQINQRCCFNTGTRQEIVAGIQSLVDNHSELIRIFRVALEQMPIDDYRVVIKADKRPVDQHERL